MNTNLRNKIAGAIYGFAIGDAMGATTEFMTSEQIKKVYGKVTNIIGGGWLRLQPGEITDDTQMTMCVMSALMRKPKDSNEFQKFCEDNFVHWVNSRPKDIGAQCSKAIKCIINHQVVSLDESALGNGSLMRAMPLAVLNLPHLNIIQGRITHNNNFCSKIIIDYTTLIQGLLNDDYEKINSVIGDYEVYGHVRLYEPTGFIYDTFNNSIVWLQELTFKDAIIGAVNHGGDADTIAAITGSLAGAKHGFNDIPKDWIKALNPDVKEFLERFAKFTFECLQI